MSLPKSSGATIDDVAKEAGVSISTVSRVINRNVPVSDEVIGRVEAAMKALNYVPRAAARNLATRKTNTIGLLLPEVLGDFFGPLLSGIESVTHNEGYDLLISTAGRRGPHDELPYSLGNHNTDGLLVFAGCLTSGGIANAHSRGVVMTLIHQTPPKEVDVPCVTIENKAAARAIVEHLITVHGRQRIVFLHGLPDSEDAYWRELGYREALAAHNIRVDPALVVPGHFARSVAQRSITQLLVESVAFDGIFTGDDEAAVGAYLALQAARRRIPEDVAVVGFDNQRLTEILTPPLTTVHAPTEEVGVQAARQLIKLLKTGKARPLTLLSTEVVIRRSCGCA